MENIVVLGGCGTVGSLMARILAKKAKVTISDTCNETPLSKVFEAENIKLDLGSHNFKLIREADSIAVAPSLLENEEILKLIKGKKIITVEDILASFRVGKPVVGVTGTNGKTTTTNILKNILKVAGYKVPEHYLNIQGNTEFIPALQARLEGDIAVVEIGTFGRPGEIKRAAEDSEVKIAIITNISRDHLPPREFPNYIECKKEILDVAQHIILNADDPIVASFAENLPREKITFYGIETLESNFEIFPEERECPYCNRPLKYKKRFLGHLGDYHCTCGYKRPKPDIKAIHVKENSYTIKIGSKKAKINPKIKGLFNVYNSLAAASAATILGIKPEHIIKGIESFQGTEGRYEIIKEKPRIIIDYAHNPAGVKAILQLVKKDTKGKIIIINTISSESGMEGDKEIAEILSNADLIIPASYQARKASKHIKSETIHIKSSKEKIKQGTLGASQKQVKEAIQKGLEHADKNDTLLIIGEGGYRYAKKIFT
ncbi:MAG TPA: Mur ligase family protein [Methanothermobacter sp.]|nr:Mur ligase middle domain protein [Methanothermobacter sp. MT-2]HHW04705.1 UDP-N-acetylmuramyl tripeptide synthetase-like protein [Methanothermobacter sp.]HOK72817.1 Mur ligase family protein [Methanothermobacter sp.]HOL69098.1 Mur ligase family protein [Methanothermobacter sp.]HPQ04766.1 Mur ligase family protein [Methanothermobacter sp.]